MTAAVLLGAALLAGCAHTAGGGAAAAAAPAIKAEAKKEKPELSAARVEQLIVKGKTTREQLVAALGAPNAVEPNAQRPSAQLLAKAKGPLPPVARTREFWKYWSNPLKSDGSTEAKIFNVLVFIDDDGVAVDYLTAESKVALP